MPNYTSPKTWNGGDTATAGDLNTYIRDLVEGMIPVGAIIHICQAATSAETLINQCWLECNGVAVSRTTYAALNTLLSGMSYPFGSGDGSTTFNLPDFRGRSFVHHATASGHANVNNLGDSDGLALASRNPKGSVSVSISGTTGSESSHTHGFTVPGETVSNVAGSSIVGQDGSYTTGAGSAHSHSFSGSGSGNVPGNYLVAGIYAIKAFT